MAKKQVQMSFYEAIEKTLDGERITRLAWDNPGEYGLMLEDNYLGIRHEGKLHAWKVHLEDIIANDWVVV